MKFYLKRNAARPLEVAEDTTLQFIPCEHVANTWVGVYRTDDKELIAKLEPFLESKEVVEITESAYNRRLQRRQKERIEANEVQTTGEYQPYKQDKSGSAKPAEVESVKDVSEDEMNATGSMEPPKTGQAYIKSLPDLAIELKVSEEELAEVRKREGCPTRTGKGYHVRSFQEFLSNASKPDQGTD